MRLRTIALSVLLLAGTAFGQYDANGWAYKRTLTDANTTSLTAFQAKVSLTSSNFNFNHANVDGSDIRFQDASTKEIVPHWIESWDRAAQTATIWVKLANAAHSTTMYFGKYGTTTTGSIASTFEAGDDFETPFGEGDSLLVNPEDYQTTPLRTGRDGKDYLDQAIHPSVIKFASAWHGYTYWMAHSGYALSDSARENTVILASNDGVTWSQPDGISNPINLTPGTGLCNSDPDIVYNDELDQLWVYSRNGPGTGAGEINLQLQTSSDGITWSATTNLITWTTEEGDLAERSPSILKRGTANWMMWGSDNTSGERLVRRTSTDGRTWSAAVACTASPSISPTIWHEEVIWIPSASKYLLINSHADTTLYLAWSTDGLAWTPAGYPFLVSSVADWDKDQIYRSAMIHDAATDLLKVWYPARNDTDWHVGYVTADFSDLYTATADIKHGWTTGLTRDLFQRSTTQAKRSTHSAKFVQGASASQTYKAVTPVSEAYYAVDFYDPGDVDIAYFRVESATTAYLMLGVNAATDADHYVYANKNATVTATTADRSTGWHKFEIRVTATAASTFWIDDVQVATGTSQFADVNRLRLTASDAEGSTFYLDDARVRLYAATEPDLSVGTEADVPQTYIEGTSGIHRSNGSVIGTSGVHAK